MDDSPGAIAARRAATIWTKIHPPFAFAQLAAWIVSLILLGFFFAGRVPFGVVQISVLVKIALMAGAVVTGSFWERAVYGYWWFAPQFFFEDLFTYTVALFQIGYLIVYYSAPDNLSANVAVLLVTYFAYGVNVTQYIIKAANRRNVLVPVPEEARRNDGRSSHR
ncbi:MAG: 2-vinyl bacteriochlorophyllide hydratase [Candidatus Baltobacteraceae bacterium]|jgi:3-vinyl bacteriochlorophyllide hydratase